MRPSLARGDDSRARVCSARYNTVIVRPFALTSVFRARRGAAVSAHAL